MKIVLLIGIVLTLVSCATLPSPSPLMPTNVAEPVSFLNGLRDGKEGTCNVSENGIPRKLPCVSYPGPRGSQIVAVRSEKGVLLFIAWIMQDGSQKTLWSRPRPTPIPGIVMA